MTELIPYLTLHTYAAAFAGVFFYLLLLASVNKHEINVRKMKMYSLLAFISSFLAWGSAEALLPGYFSGELGYGTSVSVTTYIPLFLSLQNFLLPAIVLVGAFLFYIIRKKAHALESGESSALKTIIVLSFLGFATGFALMFLGVLLP